MGKNEQINVVNLQVLSCIQHDKDSDGLYTYTYQYTVCLPTGSPDPKDAANTARSFRNDKDNRKEMFLDYTGAVLPKECLDPNFWGNGIPAGYSLFGPITIHTGEKTIDLNKAAITFEVEVQESASAKVKKKAKASVSVTKSPSVPE